MNKNELKERVDANMSETHDALQLVMGELNHGQRKKLMRSEKVKALMERYEVSIDE